LLSRVRRRIRAERCSDDDGNISRRGDGRPNDRRALVGRQPRRLIQLTEDRHGIDAGRGLEADNPIHGLEVDRIVLVKRSRKNWDDARELDDHDTDACAWS
jgi:hypothetical protein